MSKDELITFVNLVRNMRNLQKKYFKTRDQNTMYDAKNAETLVDQEIRRFDERRQCGEDLFSLDLPF